MAGSGMWTSGVASLLVSFGFLFSPPIPICSNRIDLLSRLHFLLAFTYGLLTASHPPYQQLLHALSITSEPGPVLTPLGARAAATVVLATIFLWKALITHWVGVITPKQAKQKSQ